MDKIIERKTFSKILLAIDELTTSTTDRVVDYAINIAQDYDAQLVILHVIRADTNLHSINPPSHIIGMRKAGRSLFC